MKILFFANGREATGVSEFEMETRELLSAAEVWNRLIIKFPDLEALQSTARLARNGEYATAESRFGNADEVAVIPPVSGG